MKLSWGNKILIIYIVFVLGILALVFLSLLQNRDLVSEDYYADEIAYQKTINQSSNTVNLSSDIEVNKLNDDIKIIFPKEFYGTKLTCNWTLYFAADKTRDLNGVFSSNDGIGYIKINEKIHGTYTLKLKINQVNKDYYFEKIMPL